MFDVDQLKSVGIQERFDSLRETHFVFPDVLDFFFEVPFEFHCAEDTIVGRSGTRSTRADMASAAALDSFSFKRSASGLRQQALLGLGKQG